MKISKEENGVSYYDSSNILFSTYDNLKKILYICFENGQLYSYSNINEDLNLLFESADSQGKFLNEKIKNKFKTEKDKKYSEFEINGMKSYVSKLIKESKNNSN